MGETGKAGDGAPAGTPERAKPGRVRRVPYDATAIDLIAETLDVPVALASFQLPGASVYQLVVPGKDDRPSAMLTLWPSLRRVDAVNGAATVVFTEVATVVLVAEVEVQFRRQTDEYLIAARGGKLIVRS